jgi:hypothetical protein
VKGRPTQRAAAPATTYVSPLPRHLALWALFLGVVVLSVFTVLRPALISEEEPERAAPPEAPTTAPSEHL